MTQTVPELAITVDVDVEGGLVELDHIHADLDQDQPRHLCKRRRGAARWVVGRPPGVYGIRELLGL